MKVVRVAGWAKKNPKNSYVSYGMQHRILNFSTQLEGRLKYYVIKYYVVLFCLLMPLKHSKELQCSYMYAPITSQQSNDDTFL